MKLTFDYVKQFFADNGCELLETTYQNARTHLRYMCLCGNESKIVFDSFRRGNRCQKCRSRSNSRRFKYTLEYVKLYFDDRGCELLEGEYVSSRTPMSYRCNCGNVAKICFNNFQQGKRCQHCLRIKRSGANNYQWKPDREQHKKEMEFKDRCHKALTAALKVSGNKKSGKTKTLLGYDWHDLKSHIENHPNYVNVKDVNWHLDHIFPIKAFIDYGIWDVKVINALDNLQPLKAEENCVKSDTYIIDEFINYLKRKGACQ